MDYNLRKRRLFMTRLINVTIDRPLGYQNEFGTVYPINYGYVKNIITGNGKDCSNPY